MEMSGLRKVWFLVRSFTCICEACVAKRTHAIVQSNIPAGLRAAEAVALVRGLTSKFAKCEGRQAPYACTAQRQGHIWKT